MNSPLQSDARYPSPTRRNFLAAFGAIIASVCALQGQVIVDNFDDGNINDWEVRNVVQPLGGFVSNLFLPNNNSGLALRLQRGSADMTPLGQAQDFGTGRAWLFRTNIYTDFYVAMDVVSWNNTTNQAIVLLARALGYDETLGEGFPPGLGTVSGYVCNYDNAQAGDGPTSRKGGQFQINLVQNEGTETLCAAEVTLKEGHQYRLVFKGVGASFSGHIYDYEDLTRPLVSIYAEDSTYSAGACGIVTFHRNGNVHPNLTDMTVDNYYSAPSDPGVAISPALAHPMAGTPQVTARTPVTRFTNFHPASQGITFTARTFTTNHINTAATKLYLNGVDKSASLVTPLPPNGAEASFATASGAIESNTVYEARIELSDISGTLKSTNTFWFDTFTETGVASLVTVEAEDYNHSGGMYLMSPIPPSGYDTNGVGVNGNGVGYVDLMGFSGIDFFDLRTTPEGGWNDYRSFDAVGTLQGNREDISDSLHPDPTTPPWNDPARPNDTTRAVYRALGMKEYQVARTQSGEWLNYTRDFPQGFYKVFLRAGSFGAQDVILSKVDGDITTTNQTTTDLGVFPVGNQFMRLNYLYTPLMKGSSPAVVELGGTNTLRLTIGGTAGKDDRLLFLNYLLFVPTTAPDLSTLFDPFADGNDNSSPVWTRYNPINTGAWSFPGGTSYRIQSAPSPDPATMLQGRAGSLAPGSYGDFFASVDVVGWDDSVTQVVGVLARVQNAGLATTTGYLFSHDRGNPTNQTSGDMDIVRLDGEFPTVLANVTGTDAIHFETNKQYRIVFIGQGPNFTGRVYELPNTTTPLVELTAFDETYATGAVGLMVANNAAPTYSGPADATFDNFFASRVEPKLDVSLEGGNLVLSWPDLPFRLQESPAGSPLNWTMVDSGVSVEGGRNVFRTPASGTPRFFRIVHP